MNNNNISMETESTLSLKISILGDEGIGKDKFINLFIIIPQIINCQNYYENCPSN